MIGDKMIGSSGEVIGGVIGSGMRALIGGKKRRRKTTQSDESGKCSRKLRRSALHFAVFVCNTLHDNKGYIYESLFCSGGRRRRICSTNRNSLPHLEFSGNFTFFSTSFFSTCPKLI